jgi:hypothetical protein
LALQIDGLARLVVAEPGDPTLKDGDVGIVNFAGADVDEARVLEERVRWRIPARDLYEPSAGFGGYCLPHWKPNPSCLRRIEYRISNAAYRMMECGQLAELSSFDIGDSIFDIPAYSNRINPAAATFSKYWSTDSAVTVP